jgi:hypothetical protein
MSAASFWRSCAEGGLERLGVDDEEQIARLDVDPVADRLALEIALDTRADLDGPEGFGLADVLAVHGNRARRHRDHGDRRCLRRRHRGR